MPWLEKEQPAPFDTTPIQGQWNLHGDLLARRYQQDHLKGKKYPVISFPSNLVRELADSAHPGGVVQIFSALQLWRNQSRDEAYQDAAKFGEEYFYQVQKKGNNGLIIAHPQSGSGYQVVYDNRRNQIANITRFPAHAMELMDGVSAAALPELYSNEQKGMEATALVKFFTPDANWTWYATEYDGEDLCFGLVAGLEVELGYFSLIELESIRGGLGLPVERDLHYQPKTLRELQAYHLHG